MTDSAAQVRVLLEHGDFVRRLAKGLVRDPDRAEDVVQETWLAALERPPRAPEAAVGWLRSAARNVASKLHRGDSRREARERASAGSSIDTTNMDDAGEIVQRLELQRAVVDAVLALDEPNRTAIVLRYFEDLSPDEIATRCAVPKNTVRARLRRGLERLRADLDTRHGGRRDTWLAMMIPMTGLETASAAALVATTSGASWWMTMTTKQITSLAAAALIGVVAVSLITPPDTPSTEVGRAKAPGGASAADAPELEAAERPADATAASTTREAAEDATLGDGGSSAGATPNVELAGTGTIVIQPFDSISGEPLARSVEVRFINDDRYASVAGSDRIEASLTSGTWEAALNADGFEPRKIAPFSIRPNKATDLGWVPMERGVGKIEGRVLAPYHEGTPNISVSLFGAGRGPCETCTPVDDEGEPDRAAAWEITKSCDDCGYQVEKSEHRIAGDGPFAFSGLASGTYKLRVTAEGDPIGVDRTVILDRGGYAFVDVSMFPSVTAWFDLYDEKGRPFFIDEESESIKIQTANFTFTRDEEFVTDTTYVHMSGSKQFPWSGAMRIAQDTAFLNPHVATAGSLQRIVSFQGSQIQWALTNFNPDLQVEANIRDDRAREPDDRLISARTMPDLPRPSAETTRKAAHSVEIGPLPAELLTLRVNSGSKTSGPVTVDLRPGSGRRYSLSMRDRTEEERQAAKSNPAVSTSIVAYATSDDNSRMLSTGDGAIGWLSAGASLSIDVGDGEDGPAVQSILVLPMVTDDSMPVPEESDG